MCVACLYVQYHSNSYNITQRSVILLQYFWEQISLTFRGLCYVQDMWPANCVGAIVYCSLSRACSLCARFTNEPLPLWQINNPRHVGDMWPKIDNCHASRIRAGSIRGWCHGPKIGVGYSRFRIYCGNERYSGDETTFVEDRQPLWWAEWKVISRGHGAIWWTDHPL